MPILGITMNTVTMQPRLYPSGYCHGHSWGYPSLQVHAGVCWLVFVCLGLGFSLCVCVCLSDCDCLRLWDRSLALPPEEAIWLTFSLRERPTNRLSSSGRSPSDRPFPGFHAPVTLSVSHLQIIQLQLHSLNITTTYFNQYTSVNGIFPKMRWLWSLIGRVLNLWKNIEFKEYYSCLF